MAGSMGSVVGARFVQAINTALDNNCGLVCFSACGERGCKNLSWL